MYGQRAQIHVRLPGVGYLCIYLFSKGNETMGSVPNFEFMRISTKVTQGFLVLKVPCRKSGVML
jgi:hypothetical protein